MTDCVLRLVFCCEGWAVAPAHGHNPTPHCACGWVGREHTSRLMARQEWERHTGIRGSVVASASLAGREIPAGYSRSPEVQQLLDKLQLLHNKRLGIETQE